LLAWVLAIQSEPVSVHAFGTLCRLALAQAAVDSRGSVASGGF
jgi:hypothetical protein